MEVMEAMNFQFLCSLKLFSTILFSTYPVCSINCGIDDVQIAYNDNQKFIGGKANIALVTISTDKLVVQNDSFCNVNFPEKRNITLVMNLGRENASGLNNIPQICDVEKFDEVFGEDIRVDHQFEDDKWKDMRREMMNYRKK